MNEKQPAHLDLDELSAPIKDMGLDVKSAYQKLDSEGERITASRRGLSIPLPVSHKLNLLSVSNQFLEFRKWKGSKRVCLSYCDPHDSSAQLETYPLDEWSAEERLEMLKHVPGLFSEAEKATRKFVESVRNSHLE